MYRVGQYDGCDGWEAGKVEISNVRTDGQKGKTVKCLTYEGGTFTKHILQYVVDKALTRMRMSLGFP